MSVASFQVRALMAPKNFSLKVANLRVLAAFAFNSKSLCAKEQLHVPLVLILNKEWIRSIIQCKLE